MLRQVPIKLKSKEINDKSLDSIYEMEYCLLKATKIVRRERGCLVNVV